MLERVCWHKKWWKLRFNENGALMKMQKQKKKMVLLSIAVLLLSVLLWWSEKSKTILSEDGSLLRGENGTGEYEAELILEIDETENTEWIVTVPEQRLTREEEETLLSGAIAEIEAEFAGENKSLENIKDKVNMRSGYQDGKVIAEWEFSNHGLITESGFIDEDAMEAESEMVEAKVHLDCEDSELIYEFYFIVCKQEKSEEELLYEKLNQFISENGKAEGTEFLRLPTELEGHSLVWKNKESHLPLRVFILGMVVVMLLPALEAEREKEARKKREEQLMREYPELVNKLALLLGAGMTLQGAWRQVTTKYTEKRANSQSEAGVVYEEMLIAQREMESGKGEVRAYEAFGERCGLQKYRKLSSYLIQNMKKGNRGLCELLEREATEAFAERKNAAQQYGEEVGTKLLLPMLLMLGVVIFVIMVPAVISFQAGVS